MSERMVKSLSLPMWLAEDVEALADSLGVSSWSAAAAMLLAYGVHHYSIDFSDMPQLNLDDQLADYEAWEIETGTRCSQETYLLDQVMAKHGGARPGAGRPPADDESTD